jgi:hypothetical protein
MQEQVLPSIKSVNYKMNSNINSNLTRHLELLKRSEHFKNLGQSFYKEEEENCLEFLGYETDIEDYLYWNKRFEIFSMMKKFLDGIISGEQLSYLSSELREKVNQKIYKLISNLSSRKFQDFNPDLRLKCLLRG